MLAYATDLSSTHTHTEELTLAFSSVEVNVSIMCSCMPSCAHYLRTHVQSLYSLSGRLREKYHSITSSRKQSSSMKLNGFERADSNPSPNNDDKMRLTLGSAVRDGKFLGTKTERQVWPLESVHEGGRRTHRESWEQSTLRGSVV